MISKDINKTEARTKEILKELDELKEQIHVTKEAIDKLLVKQQKNTIKLT